MTDRYDPAWVNKTKNTCWAFMVSQLGHWNKMKVMAIDCTMYDKLPKPVLDAIANEATLSQNKAYIWAQDGTNRDVYLLGPQKTMQRDLITVGGVLVWDPTHVHVDMPTKRGRDTKVPRPPNAFILYRKDKHAELKESFPEIRNNEISILVGSMWKDETPEVRATYFEKSERLKSQLLNLNPGYKYRPRKSDEIPRRRGLRILGTTAHSFPVPDGTPNVYVLRKRDDDTVQAVFPGACTADSDEGVVTIQQVTLVRPSLPVQVNNWVPNAVPMAHEGVAEQLLHGEPYINPAVTFGKTVPNINLNGAILLEPEVNEATDDFVDQLVDDS